MSLAVLTLSMKSEKSRNATASLGGILLHFSSFEVSAVLMELVLLYLSENTSLGRFGSLPQF